MIIRVEDSPIISLINCMIQAVGISILNFTSFGEKGGGAQRIIPLSYPGKGLGVVFRS